MLFPVLTEHYLFSAVGEEIYPKEEDFFALVDDVEMEASHAGGEKTNTAVSSEFSTQSI